jgi:hypothetical protein
MYLLKQIPGSSMAVDGARVKGVDDCVFTQSDRTIAREVGRCSMDLDRATLYEVENQADGSEGSSQRSGAAASGGG